LTTPSLQARTNGSEFRLETWGIPSHYARRPLIDNEPFFSVRDDVQQTIVVKMSDSNENPTPGPSETPKGKRPYRLSEAALAQRRNARRQKPKMPEVSEPTESRRPAPVEIPDGPGRTCGMVPADIPVDDPTSSSNGDSARGSGDFDPENRLNPQETSLYEMIRTIACCEVAKVLTEIDFARPLPVPVGGMFADFSNRIDHPLHALRLHLVRSPTEAAR